MQKGSSPNDGSNSHGFEESEDSEDEEVERVLVDLPEEDSERSHGSDLAMRREGRGGRSRAQAGAVDERTWDERDLERTRGSQKNHALKEKRRVISDRS